jgi:hypothetical protein
MPLSLARKPFMRAGGDVTCDWEFTSQSGHSALLIMLVQKNRRKSGRLLGGGERLARTGDRQGALKRPRRKRKIYSASKPPSAAEGRLKHGTFLAGRVAEFPNRSWSNCTVIPTTGAFF